MIKNPQAVQELFELSFKKGLRWGVAFRSSGECGCQRDNRRCSEILNGTVELQGCGGFAKFRMK